ncbi:MAG: NUDIX domain-containing protein [Dehalococcoidia bacterium]
MFEVEQADFCVIPEPAATVIPLREAGDGYEVLLIHRNPTLSFHGGIWAFPGGKVEDIDYDNENNDILAAARRAAVREAHEEAGILIRVQNLFLISRWTTPERQSRRYKTWFFAAAIDDQNVRVDGEETLGYRWIKPGEAIKAQGTGEMQMVPPTYVTLADLSKYKTLEGLVASFEGRSLEVFLPRIKILPGGFCSLYHGDAAYDGGDIHQPGGRHRLWGMETGWYYERTE